MNPEQPKEDKHDQTKKDYFYCQSELGGGNRCTTVCSTCIPKEDKAQDHIADTGQMVSDSRDWKEKLIDWREKFSEWWLCNGSEYLSQDQQDAILEHFYRYYIQPLQSQNNELKDNLKAAIQISKESKRRIFDLFNANRNWHKAKIEALQKEVETLKSVIDPDGALGIEKLKAEIKAWEDQDGIAKDAAQEEIERLQKIIERLHTAAFGSSMFDWQQFKIEHNI